MATETQDGVELRNTVDNSAAEEGLKKLESATDATLKHISGASESQARAEEAAAKRREARLKKGVTMGLSIGMGALDAAGQAVRLAGAESLGAGMTSAADGARMLGTMLAPLGPEAAAAGAAFGLLSGALKTFADDAAETRRKMEAAAQGGRDMAADAALSREDFERLKREDPEAAAKAQHEAQETIRRAAKRNEMGARVDLDALAPLAAFDPETVRRIFEDQSVRLGNRGGDKAATVFAAMDYDRQKGIYDEAKAREAAAGGLFDFVTRGRMANRAAEAKSRMDLAETNPELVAAFGGGGPGWDEGLSALWDKMEAERLAEIEAKRNAALAGDGGAESETPSRLGPTLAGPKADALSAVGIGYTGSPMQKTEELLREIRDDARERGRRPAAAQLTA